MSTTLDRVAELTPQVRTRRWRWVGRAAIGVWAVALGAWSLHYGLPEDRSLVMLWVALGLGAACIGRRSVGALLVDWLPFALVLVVYDFARRAAVLVSGFTVWTPQITLDRTLFGGVEPTVWLQEHLKRPFPPWWEVVVSACYASLFIVPYATAAALWLRSRTQFRRWAARFVGMSLIAVGCFTVLPSAPPWAAALCTQADVSSHPPDPACMHADPVASLAIQGGLLGPVHPVHQLAAPYIERISGRGWNVVGLHLAETAIYRGQSIANLVAAFPSLHEGSALLFAFFFWRRTRRWLRPLLALYPLLMAFTLVYTGEHYVTDVLGAVVLVLLVQWLAGRVERRWERRRLRPADTLEEP